MPQAVPMQKISNNSLYSAPKFLKKRYPAPWQFQPFLVNVLTKNPAVDLSPSADSHCTNCGLCAEKCPAQAISKYNGKVTDKSKCISCMRCVSICPVHARNVNKVMVSVAEFAIKKACSVQKSNELFL